MKNILAALFLSAASALASSPTFDNVTVTGSLTVSGKTAGTLSGTQTWTGSNNFTGPFQIGGTSVGTAAFAGTGTGSTQVPKNSDLGSGAYISAGQNAAQVVGNIPGLQYWWRASAVSGTYGSTVNTWSPVSGTLSISGTAIKTTTATGYPAIGFNGTNQSFTIPASTLTVASSTTGLSFFVVVESDTTNNSKPFVYQTNSDYIAALNAGGFSAASGGNTYYGPSNIAQTHVIVVSSGTTNDVYIDGVTHRASTSSGAGYTFSSTIPVAIGKKTDGSLWFSGRIAEVGYIARAVTSAESRAITSAFGYYRQTYQNAPNFTAVGDSNTDASVVGLTSGWAYLVSGSLGSTWNYVNNAIGGDTASSEASLYTIKSGWQYSNNRKVNVLPIALGTNDIALLGSNAATVEAAIQSNWQKSSAQGYYPIAFTIPPSTLTNVNTVRATVNPWIRANYAQYCYGLVDVAADATIGPDAAASNTTYYSDGTHWTGTSNVIVASLALPVIQRVANSITYGSALVSGTLTLSSGSATVVNPMVSTNSTFRIGVAASGGTPGPVSIFAFTGSFTAVSASVLDTSTLNYSVQNIIP